ncbi:MAG: GNAT family N-acetyltransferase [Firmicutes bacterium]|nr:GNAT family N-acetyltransferase [Bacillota bacterium]
MQIELLNQLKNLYKEGFKEDNEAFVSWFFAGIKEENAVTVFEGESIVSAGFIVPKPAVVWGREVQVPYLSALATSPDFRGQGKIGEVIRGLLSRLKDRKEPFCLLYPFNHDYYKRYGFRNISFCEEKEITGGKDFEGIVVSLKDGIKKTVSDLFLKESKKFKNKAKLWHEEILLNKIKEYSTYPAPLYLWLDEKKEPFAVCFADEKRVHLYATNNSEKFLQIEQLKGRVIFYFGSGTQPYIQARLICVSEALRRAPWLIKEKIAISVTDNILEDNTGCYIVENGKVRKCKKEESVTADYHLTLEELTELLLLGDGKLIKRQSNYFPEQY